MPSKLEISKCTNTAKKYFSKHLSIYKAIGIMYFTHFFSTSPTPPLSKTHLCVLKQFLPAAVSVNTVSSLKILAHYTVRTVREVMRVAAVISFLTNPVHEIPVRKKNHKVQGSPKRIHDQCTPPVTHESSI